MEEFTRILYPTKGKPRNYREVAANIESYFKNKTCQWLDNVREAVASECFPGSLQKTFIFICIAVSAELTAMREIKCLVDTRKDEIKEDREREEVRRCKQQEQREEEERHKTEAQQQRESQLQEEADKDREAMYERGATSTAVAQCPTPREISL